MTTQTIDTLDGEPYFTSRVRLDERDYTLEFWYSTRSENYSLTIYDVEENLLRAGLRLFPLVNLLAPHRWDPRLPQGELIVACFVADQSPPKLGELGAGKRCELTYMPAADLAAVKAELRAEAV